MQSQLLKRAAISTRMLRPNWLKDLSAVQLLWPQQSKQMMVPYMSLLPRWHTCNYNY